MNITIEVKPSTKGNEVRVPRKITYFPVPTRIRSEYAALQSQKLDGDDDAEWFDTHPQAAHRVRAVSLIERNAYGFGRDISVIVSLRPDGSHVRQYVPACVVRDPAAPPEVVETDGQDSFEFLDSLPGGFDPWWFRSN